MAAATKKLFKDAIDALISVLGTTDVPAEVASAVIGVDKAFAGPDPFADAAVAAGIDEADYLHRALAYGTGQSDPPIECEAFLERILKALPDLVGMQVQRGLGKAGGIGAKSCAVSLFSPQLRDMAKKITHATFMKEIFKAFKGAPAKKAAPPPPPPAGTATKKFFGKKTEETPSTAAPAITTTTTPATDDATVVASTKKTFGTKKTTDTPAAPTTTTTDSSITSATAGGADDGATVVSATKKTFFGKKRTSENETPSSEVNGPAAFEPAPVAEEVSPPPTKKTFAKKVITESPPQDNVSAPPPEETSKTFGTKKTFGETSNTSAAAPVTSTTTESAATSGGEVEVVSSTKKTFVGKKKTPTTSELPSEAASRSQSQLHPSDSINSGPTVSTSINNYNNAATNYTNLEETTPTRRTFGSAQTTTSTTTTKTAGTSSFTSTAPSQQAQYNSPTTTGSPFASGSTYQQGIPNTLSNRPTVVSETSSNGSVITPRCPECASRFLIRREEVACQTDWGARFMTAADARDTNTRDGRVQALLRSDINSAVEEAQNKANQLLEMKRAFVEARMRAISDAEAAILRSLPPSDRERLTALQTSLSSASQQQQQPPRPHPSVDYLRAARATTLSNSNAALVLLPDDDDAYLRLREGANHRLRALAEEEAHIKEQLSALEEARHNELDAASKGRAMLMSANANANANNNNNNNSTFIADRSGSSQNSNTKMTPLSQWNSGAGGNGSPASSNGSTGRRTKRW